MNNLALLSRSVRIGRLEATLLLRLVAVARAIAIGPVGIYDYDLNWRRRRGRRRQGRRRGRRRRRW